MAPANCGSYLCPECSKLLQMSARVAIEGGILKAALRRLPDDPAEVRRPEVVVFVTLTEPAAVSLDLPGFRRRWEATKQRLRRAWGMTEYAVAVEFQQRGALHPHVFAEVAREVAEDLRDRSSRASFGRRMHELRPLAESLGWGQMVDAITVPLMEAESMGQYGAKALAGYATKEAAERFKRAGAKRVRPLRLSAGWIPGGLEGVRERLRADPEMGDSFDPGPWRRVKAVCA